MGLQDAGSGSEWGQRIVNIDCVVQRKSWTYRDGCLVFFWLRCFSAVDFEHSEDW